MSKGNNTRQLKIPPLEDSCVQYKMSKGSNTRQLKIPPLEDFCVQDEQGKQYKANEDTTIRRFLCSVQDEQGSNKRQLKIPPLEDSCVQYKMSKGSNTRHRRYHHWKISVVSTSLAREAIRGS
ncbi:hypothetical protein ElyMa_002052200 [Elysia marginata]|uniref:Uncharacterized protein n=1 Tax=Elysia marginata TaxID=1093978 RepID=A0AAV4F9V2_9GAST|nr:hypothetical protein ElyMa_002052200 [Elysia marginata]